MKISTLVYIENKKALESVILGEELVASLHVVAMDVLLSNIGKDFDVWFEEDQIVRNGGDVDFHVKSCCEKFQLNGSWFGGGYRIQKKE